MPSHALLIEASDVLFSRDAIPMSAGQGKGAGARLPFPSTLHEAFRASLLLARGERPSGKSVPGRPRKAIRKGNWHETNRATDINIATKSFRSLQTVGPLPFLTEARSKSSAPLGLYLPVPLDAALQSADSPVSPRQLARLRLLRDPSVAATATAGRSLRNQTSLLPCLPVATTPPDKHGTPRGWWTVPQYRAYLEGRPLPAGGSFDAMSTDELWQPEHRIGVQIDPNSFAAADRQLYAATVLRPHVGLRFACEARLNQPHDSEEEELTALDWLLLGGEQRLARLTPASPFASLPVPPGVIGDGPCLLSWSLVTPAIFTQGHIPGWCVDTSTNSAGVARPPGFVCLRLPGRARLIAACLGRPQTVSGWDTVEQKPKSTMLAVPAGSVFYFLCESAATGTELARVLHWRPRSDFYGEKGCGYGLCSFAIKLHRTSPDLRALASELLTN